MAECATGDAVYIGPFSAVHKFFDGGIEGILNDIASAIMSAAVNLFADLAADIPTLPGKTEAENKTLLDKIGLQINWLVVTIAVASLLFAAARMALERRGQAGTTALKGMLKVILVAGAFSYVVVRLSQLADDYTKHLYQAGVKEQLKSIAACGTDSLTAFLLIIIGLLLILAGIIHIMLLFIRLGVMVVLSGTLPLAAAASMTEWGGSWWRKHIAWMVAWLAFKPATGLVMYAGAVMVNSSGTSVSQQKIAGCGVLLLSAVSLPALLRLIVPAMAALGSGDATAGIAAGAAGGAAKAATGAVAVPAMNYAKGGAGPKGASGSGGPSGGTGSAGSSGGSGSSGGRGPGGASSSGGSGGPGSGRSMGSRVASGAGHAASGAARVTAGAVGAATYAGAFVAGQAARHGRSVVSGALPGPGDGDER